MQIGQTGRFHQCSLERSHVEHTIVPQRPRLLSELTLWAKTLAFCIVGDNEKIHFNLDSEAETCLVS
jgi:hypothetical protein